MKTKMILSFALLAMLAACSNNDNVKPEDGDKGKVDITQGIEFKVNFKDFNTEKEYAGTRTTPTSDTISRKTIDLGNNLLAEVTVQRDPARATRSIAATRALENDDYTMLVFQGSFPTYTLKGEITGTLKDGKFTPNMHLRLAPGPYIFMLHNNRMTKVTTPMGTIGLKLTRDNAEKALLARTDYTVTATPDPQYVDFQMSHVGCRMRIKFTAWMPIQASTTASIQAYNSNLLPKDCTFELPYSGDKLTDGELNPLNEPLTFPASATTPNADGTYTTQSNEFLYFVPGTDMEGFKLKFTGGQIYKMNMAGASVNLISLVDPNIHSAHVMSINESYLVNINLKYNFLYLMSDGTTDFLNSTQYTALRASDGKTKRYVDKQGTVLATPKVPIAVVLSQSKGMAVALKNANGGVPTWWSTNKYWYKQTNTHGATNQTDALNSQATSGLDETWDPNYSTSNVIGEKVKGKNSDFPAFYAAAHYDPGTVYTGSPALQWYLPSYSDFKWMFSSLGLGDKTVVTQPAVNYSWYGSLADIALTQVGGDAITGAMYLKRYWSSSEYVVTGLYGTDTYGNAFLANPTDGYWGGYAISQYDNLVRPFVKYK